MASQAEPLSHPPALPEAVASFGAVTHDGALYVCGGYKGERHAYAAHLTSGALHRLPLQPGGTWEILPAAEPAQGAPLAALNQQVYCIGGIDADGTSSKVDILHVTTGTWSQGPELPRGPMKGFGCSAIAHQGRLYVSGMKGDVWALSPDGLQWSVVGTLQHPRFFHRLVPGGPHQLLALGGEDSDGKRIDVETVFPTAIGQLAQGSLP